MKKYLDELRNIWYLNTAKKLPVRVYVLYALTGALLAFVLTLVFNVTGLSQLSSYSSVAERQFNYFASPVMLFLLYCVFMPILEEVVFRFVIYNSLLMALKKTLWAIVISSIIFGIYHLNPVQGLYAFLMGLFIAFSYHKTESIFTPIIVHASANLVALAYTIFFL